MMGSFSIWHWLILAAVAAVFFGGRGKISSIMGDAAKGIRAFQDGLKDGDKAHVDAPPPAGAIPSETTLERQAADKK